MCLATDRLAARNTWNIEMSLEINSSESDIHSMGYKLKITYTQNVSINHLDGDHFETMNGCEQLVNQLKQNQFDEIKCIYISFYYKYSLKLSHNLNIFYC